MTSYSSSNELKALVLAGGRGKRLKDQTDQRNKCMLEFEGKRLIEYSLNNAVKFGADEIVVVVGYLAESIVNAFGNRYEQTPIKYVIQWEQLGLVDAIECSSSTIDGADFVLLLGDEFLIDADYSSLIGTFREKQAFAVCGIIEVDDRANIAKTYSVLSADNSCRIFRLIEKPRYPSNDLMGTGNIVFKNAIFDYIDQTPINQKRGEKELPDLVQCAIDDNKEGNYSPGRSAINSRTHIPVHDVEIFQQNA